MKASTSRRKEMLQTRAEINEIKQIIEKVQAQSRFFQKINKTDYFSQESWGENKTKRESTSPASGMKEGPSL